jgi:hypothetical protein
MNPAPPTFEEVQQKRLSQLLNACIDLSFGSVWRIREGMWIKTFLQQGQRYDKNSKRKWHPGVSLRTAPVASVHEYLPMLHGSSGDHGPVVVRGLTREHGDEHETSFGKIVRPAKLTVKDATAATRRVAKKDLEGRLIDKTLISANLDKPRLDEAELEALRKWASNQNLL